MSWRWLNKRLEKAGVSITETWGNKAKVGKLMKRGLHKAERSHAKGHGAKERNIAGWSHEVNWKGW